MQGDYTAYREIAQSWYPEEKRWSMEQTQGRLLGPAVARGHSEVSRALLAFSFASSVSAAGAGSDPWELREKSGGRGRGGGGEDEDAGLEARRAPLGKGGQFCYLGPPERQRSYLGLASAEVPYANVSLLDQKETLQMALCNLL